MSRLDVQSTRARIEIRVPAYEVRHVTEPARTIPAAIEINGAQPASATCSEESGTYVCRSEYGLSVAGPLRVRCLLARVIVSNHVHVMHAARNGRIDQAVFDINLPEAILTFRETGPIESAVRSRPQMIGVLLLVMLAAGVLGAAWREAVWVSGAVFAGVVGASAVRSLPWQMTPGFLETAVAVISAYAAFEVIAFASGAWRLVAAVLLGVVFGRYAFTLAGAPSAVAMLAAGVVLPAFGIAWISRRFPVARKTVAWVALTVALTWIAVALL